MTCDPLHQMRGLEITRCVGDASRRAPSTSRWPTFEMHFQDDGAYFLHDGSHTRLVDARHVEIRRAASELAYSRPPVRVDRGTSIRLSPKLGALIAPDAMKREVAPDIAQLRSISWKTFLRWRALRRTVTEGIVRSQHDDLEQRVIALLAEITRGPARSEQSNEVSSDSRRTRSAARHREAVERAKEFLVVNASGRPSLIEVAAASGYAPHHLARLFRSTTGLSVHRYLTELRLRQAAARLDDGADNLSSLALDLGFSSHSHFTTVFGAWFGCTPEEYRDPRKRNRAD